MGYVIPALNDLIDQVDKMTGDYNSQRVAPNPERLALLNMLSKIKAFLAQIQKSDEYNLEPAEAQSVLLGAYLYCLEAIAKEYRLANPEFKEGYIYNSGSKLYLLLLNTLQINQQNKLTDSEKLIHLSHFYQFFKNNAESLKAEFNDVQAYLLNIKNMIKAVFMLDHDNVKKTIKSVPVEAVIDRSMSKIPEDYMQLRNANNDERQFYIKLIKAMSQVLPMDNQAQNSQHFLSRRQRIKMGFLLFLMQDIWDSYVIRSPEGNSVLYDLCRQSMNIEKISDIDNHTRLACLTAFETFISDNDCIGLLEKEVTMYLDPKLRLVRKQIDTHIEQLQPSHSSKLMSGFAISCASLGAIIASAPGYGIGYSIGYAASQVDEMVDVKLGITKVTDYTMTLILGKVGGYLGYFAANMVVDATLERGFAKVFEALAMVTGAAAGGVIGLVIYDLSYLTLMSLCKLHTELCRQLSPNLAKDLDPSYVECLLDLPEEIFSQENKKHIHSITGQGLFREQQVVASAQAQDDSEQLLQLSNSY